VDIVEERPEEERRPIGIAFPEQEETPTQLSEVETLTLIDRRVHAVRPACHRASGSYMVLARN
jgi:hypothetical protein